MYSNYEKIMKTFDYLINVDLKNMSMEKEFAIERAFETIGGILREWENKGIIKKDSHLLIKSAIAMRNKMSHFYHGLNINYVVAAIKDIPDLMNIIKKMDIEKS